MTKWEVSNLPCVGAPGGTKEPDGSSNLGKCAEASAQKRAEHHPHNPSPPQSNHAAPASALGWS